VAPGHVVAVPGHTYGIVTLVIAHYITLGKVVRVRSSIIGATLMPLVADEVSITIIGASLMLLLVIDGVGPVLGGWLLHLLFGIARLVLLIDDLSRIVVVLINTLLFEVVRTSL
jgi:hypothetical protein